jgi:hypothetical protein
MAQVTIADVMEFLADHAAPNLPSSALADIFGRLVWCLDDNGEKLLAHRDEWLRGPNLSRAAIALAMDETFPFGAQAEMEAELSRVAARWPALEKRCRELVESRRAAEK